MLIFFSKLILYLIFVVEKKREYKPKKVQTKKNQL